MRSLYPILSAVCGVLRDVRVLAATALLLLSLAAPASAQVTMAPLKPCYVSDGDLPTQRETIAVHTSGFTPLATLTLSIDGQPVDKGVADAFGVADWNETAPFEGRDEHDFTLTVVEDLNPDHNFVSATSRVTNLSVTLTPRVAAPSRKVRFSGRGFTAAAPVYGHYVFGGKARKTVRFAPQSGAPCGTFHARRRQIPLKDPAFGKWTLQVDQQRHYAALPATNAQRVIIHVQKSLKQP
jgi:hypothetical protein